jgi:hypothetical protein
VALWFEFCRAESGSSLQPPSQPEGGRFHPHTPQWGGRFLRALRQTPSVNHACAAAGIDRATAYRNRQQDEAFAAQCQDAIQAGVDELKHKAFQLALGGDSNLITFMLRCHKPEVYRDLQKHEVGLLGGIVLFPPKEKGAE